MSTQAYERIQAKLKLSGREYFEGLSSSDFAGLTSEEFAEVRDALQVRSRQGDGVSLDALRSVMSPEDYLAFAEGLLRETGGAGILVSQLSVAIFEVSPSEVAWKNLLSVLRSADSPGRRWILNRISLDSLKREWKSELVEVLAALILKESDSSLLLSEAVSLLLAKGFVPRSPQIAEYAKRLQNADEKMRLTVLVELGVAG